MTLLSIYAEPVPTCVACGQDNPDIARFCLSCGKPLAEAPAATEERRVISVVFVDLVGFTSTAEQMDPEDVRAILAPYYDRVRKELESFGGVVEKFIGDAVMAVFGAPTSHGDDPERAVRAALAARDAVTASNVGAATELAVRVAVNTGDALVNLSVRPDSGEGMVAGDVVNTASRLQAFAPVNGVLVGAETYRCTRHVISYQAAPEVTAKGKSAPLEVWLALDPKTAPGDRPQIDTPFVGRTREMTLLEQTWERAMVDQRPQLVTVFGPPGVGKTRLGLEFAEHVAASGGRTLRGRSLPYREGSAYGALAWQVKQYAEIYENDAQDVAMKKLRECVGPLLAQTDAAAEALDHLAVILGYTPENEIADRDSLFYSVRCFIEALARQQPTLLVFEDIHWADTSLLELIELLATRLHDLPVLLLTLSRPELLDTQPTWGQGLWSYMAVPLEPLASSEAQQLARALLTAHASDDGRIAGLAETAEGNPLFIEQLAAALSERATGETALPTTIRGIVAARLDALPPAERAVLLAASVSGRIFWTGALSQMVDAATLPSALAALERRDLIRRDTVSVIKNEQQYAFKHMLIRDASYETLPRKKRQEMHQQLAEYLESIVSTDGEAAGAALARHWRGAGRPDRALGYLVAAADTAFRGWAKGHAAELYREAISCADPDDAELVKSLRRRQAVAWQAHWHERDARALGRGSSE
jgi:class 3 adenylate cyclase